MTGPRRWLSILLLLLAGCSSQKDLVEGNRAYARGDAKAALVAYARALQSPETSATANLNMGRVYLEVGDAKSAMPHLDQGLQARPDFALGYVHRARAEIMLERGDEALRDLHKAVALDSNLREGWLELGKLLAARGQPGPALEALDKVRPYGAYQAEATLVGLPLRRQLGQSQAAIADLEALTQSQPYLAQPYFELGSLRLESRDFSEAERKLRQGLQLEPGNLAGRLALARSLSERGDWRQAGPEFEAVAGAGDPVLAAQAREALAHRPP